MIEPKWRFSRSHMTAYRTCPFYYWNRFHADGTGYEKKILNAGLSKGTMAHSILQGVLSIARDEDRVPSADELRDMFKAERIVYRMAIEKRGLEDVEEEFVADETNANMALVEGVVRSWARMRLPILMEDYKVIGVEKETEVVLSDDGVTVMCRPDAYLQHRTSGSIVPLEFKTTSTNLDNYFQSWQYATQVMVHLLAAEKEYGQMGDGVRMEFLYTGYKRKDKMSGQILYYSPLVKGFVKYGNPPLNDDEYAWGNEMSRKAGWSGFYVWDHSFAGKPAYMTDQEYWTEHVLDNFALSAHLFDRMVYRNDDDIKEWVAGAVQTQRKIFVGVQAMASASQEADREIAKAAFFPANKDEGCFSNKYHKKCEFLPYCYHEVDKLAGCSLYVVREPHHEMEFEVE